MFLERLNLFFIFKTARKGSGRLTENGWKKNGGGEVEGSQKHKDCTNFIDQ